MKIPLKVKLVLYFLLILSLSLYLTFKKKGLIDYLQLKTKYNELVKENNQLQEENKKLLKTIEKLKTDKAYIEKIAREKYNMIGKGEILIKINNKGGRK